MKKTIIAIIIISVACSGCTCVRTISRGEASGDNMNTEASASKEETTCSASAGIKNALMLSLAGVISLAGIMAINKAAAK